MKKIQVQFQINSEDTSNSFQSIGEYKNNRIKFLDNENNTNYIIFHKDIIEYYKKGSVDMKYKFKEFATTKGEYTLQGYKFDFDIVTEKIDRKDGLLRLKYDLYQNNDLVNKTEIIIEYTFLKEE